ncbi:hypothetical protein B9Z55_023495 [Caenorhabditis nigoni]|uniref:F-box domain-containing protein n=1 Tax=Caenorhabditis nigoni TaxID=1611254 RepID=A0A2G5SQ59_9PELO|nr:hypothetical protein B9Z55_023495 [Caenorhabditis nigoni]
MDFSTIDVEGAEYKKAAILFCYRTNHSVDSAYTLLSQEFLDVTKRNVAAWFAELRLAEIPVPVVDGNEKEKVLFSLSANLLKEVTKYLSAQDLNSMSLVCKTLNQFVARLDLRIDLIRICLKPDSIEIKTAKPGSSSLCQITKTTDGCSVTKDGATTQQTCTFLEQMADEFERCLGRENRKVRKLDIQLDEQSGDHQAEFFGQLIATLGRLDSPLDCEILHTDFCPSDLMRSILEKLSSEHLNSLKIKHATLMRDTERPYDMSGIISLPHWKQLTDFRCFSTLESISLSDLGHVEYVYAKMSYVTTEDIVAYIMTCSRNSPYCQSIMVQIANMEDLAARLLPFGFQKNGNVYSGQIPSESGGYTKFKISEFNLYVRGSI